MHALERRILALEARLADVEGGYGQTLYDLRRDSVRNRMQMARLLDHLQIPAVTDDEVDTALDEA